MQWGTGDAFADFGIGLLPTRAAVVCNIQFSCRGNPRCRVYYSDGAFRELLRIYIIKMCMRRDSPIQGSIGMPPQISVLRTRPQQYS